MIRKTLNTLCIAGFAALLSGAAAISARVSVTESDLAGFAFTYHPGKAEVDTLRTGDRTYLSFIYPGHALDGDEGMPQLPVEAVYFVAPSGVTPSVTVTTGAATLHDRSTLIPVPTMHADPTGNAVEEYIENAEAFARSGWQPASNAHLEATLTEGTVTVWRIQLAPVRFDAYRNLVETLDGIEVTVTIPGSFDGLGAGARIPSYAVNEPVVRAHLLRNSAARTAAVEENPFDLGDWYRITVTESGMYRITGSELAQAGFPAGSVTTDTMHLYYGGGRMLGENPSTPTVGQFREMAMTVRDGGDGIFDASDTMVFYGQALTRFTLDPGDSVAVHQNYLYADTGANVYWLQVRQNGLPGRTPQRSGAPSPGLDPVTTYRETLHLEPENYIEIADGYGAESGLDWYWEAVGGQTRTFTFDAPGCTADPDAFLRLGIRKGLSITGSSTQYYLRHTIGYSINGQNFHLFTVDTTFYGALVKEVPVESTLHAQSNTIEMNRQISTDIQNFRFDWLEVEYNRQLALSSGALEFFYRGDGGPQLFTVGNVMSPLVEVYDTTDPWAVTLLTGAVYNSTGHTLSFEDNAGDDILARYLVVTTSQYRKAGSITRKQHTNLRSATNTADYIIITYRDFYGSAQTLANWRSHDSSTDPLTTMVVDVADIYDEFAWGVFDPVAIRDFLHYAWLNYNQGLKHVRYCLMFGDTTYRYKNIANQTEKNYVPSYTAFKGGEGIITDDFFVWFDTNEVPEIALGRMCIPDAGTAEQLVEKTIAYERDAAPGRWHNRILYIADDEYVFAGAIDSSNLFATDVEKLDNESGIPASFERTKILLIEYPLINREKLAVTGDIFDEINEGCLLVNFVGHGNNDVLAHENILRGSRDMDKFANGPRQPVFLAFSCTVGKFDKPGIKSLTESMHLRENGGCIATVSASRTTYNSANMQLNKVFYLNLFDTVQNPDARLGQALYEAKKQLGMSGDTNSRKYFLFGDPATRLMMPQAAITASVPDTLRRLDPLDITGIIDPAGAVGEVTLRVTAQGPRQHLVYKNPSSDNVTFDYTKPGTTFFRGDYVLPASDLRFSVIVPKDVESDLTLAPDLQRESKILLYAVGESFEASGAIENYYIGGIDTTAALDTAGPSMNLSFDGKVFESGDIIRRQPEITVTFNDPSGINIAGTRGHNIKLLIDRTESIVLSDQYIATGGIAEGALTYSVPMLTVGEHEFELSAYDNNNNTSKIAVTATVAGSETGDIAIQNLLNYPNPMANNGTTFTFNLTDFAHYASIRVYSQAGRLVDTITFPADYGFNKVYWKPPVVLANGVYFYKLSVTSANGRKSSKIEKLVMMR